MVSRHRDSFEISYEEKEVEFSDGYERELVCPHCGSNYLHHYGFTDYERNEDEKTSSVVDCGAALFNEDGTKYTVFGRDDGSPGLGGNLQVFSDLDSFRNPSSRRNGIVIKFWCELCPHISLLCIAQHKGCSQMYWRAIKMKPQKVATPKRKRIKPKLRFTVLKRDNYTCQSCGATPQDGAKLEIDHIKPIAMGGSDDIENLQILCRECNLGKGARES